MLSDPGSPAGHALSHEGRLVLCILPASHAVIVLTARIIYITSIKAVRSAAAVGGRQSFAPRLARVPLEGKGGAASEGDELVRIVGQRVEGADDLLPIPIMVAFAELIHGRAFWHVAAPTAIAGSRLVDLSSVAAGTNLGFVFAAALRKVADAIAINEFPKRRTTEDTSIHAY